MASIGFSTTITRRYAYHCNDLSDAMEKHERPYLETTQFKESGSGGLSVYSP